MSTVQAFVGLVVGLVAILAGVAAAVRIIWKAAASTTTLVGSVDANTAATAELSVDLKEFSTATAATLADHGTRLTRLESR